MIQTIEGRIGGGKTYMAMDWICNHIAKGGVVASNINVQLESFEDQYGEKRGIKWALRRMYGYEMQDEQFIPLSDTRLVQYPTKKGNIDLNEIVMFFKLVPRGTPKQPVLVVIDEAHIHFPQDGYRTIPKEVLHFLTLSRHACVDVVFISQHIKNMWCQMMRLAQFRWSVRDMKKFGLPLGWFNVPWPFPHFLQNKFDSDGVTIMGRKFNWHNTVLYETYRSPELAAAFESMPVANSVEIKKVEMNMKQKIVLFGVGVACGLAVLIVPACKSSSPDPVVEGVASATVINTNSISVPEEVYISPVVESEFYIGHLDSGWESKFFTTKKTYLIGDLYDGFVVIGCRSNRLVLFDDETEEYFEEWFSSKGRDSAK